MDDGGFSLAWLPILDGAGVVGVVILIGVAILRGWLIPRSTHTQVVQILEKARDDERTRANAADAARERQQDVAQDLLDRIIATLGTGKESGGGGHGV